MARGTRAHPVQTLHRRRSLKYAAIVAQGEARISSMRAFLHFPRGMLRAACRVMDAKCSNSR